MEAFSASRFVWLEILRISVVSWETFSTLLLFSRAAFISSVIPPITSLV